MNNKNVVLDFTNNEKVMNELTANQPLAIMPAHLAKQLLYRWAKNLQETPVQRILNDYAIMIQHAKSIDEAKQMSIEFVQIRELIDACADANWDKYVVNNDKTVDNDNPIGYTVD